MAFWTEFNSKSVGGCKTEDVIAKDYTCLKTVRFNDCNRQINQDRDRML